MVVLFLCFLAFSLCGYLSLYLGYMSNVDLWISFGYFSIIPAILCFIVIVSNIFKYICNQSKHKNPISTSVQSNTTINTEHPVINKINNIISELSKLQQEFKGKDLDTNIFIKFNLLKDKFDKDLKNIQSVVNQLHYIGQNNNQSYLQLLNNYLDLFDKEKQIIYNNIQQQCNEELNMVNNELHDFKQIVDKVV